MKKEMMNKLTSKLIERVELAIENNEVAPWRKPWSGGLPPMNYSTKKAYKGFNHVMLNSMCYESPYFLTYNQAKKLGGNVIKGSKGNTIFFYSRYNKKEVVNGKETKRDIWFTKTSYVYNATQIEGIDFKTIDITEIDFTENTDCESIISNYGISTQVGQRACYSPSMDVITMPKKETFVHENEYYSTLFHEAIHSTGHKSRCDRDLSGGMRSDSYSKEELVAEIGANLLANICGVASESVEDNNVAYLNSWLSALKNDPAMLLQASSFAQKGVDHIMKFSEIQTEVA